MTRQTFKKIKELLSAGKFLMGYHAKKRAQERIITPADIQSLGRTAKSCTLQKDNTYLVSGKDLDDCELTLVVKILDEQLFIITNW